MKKRVYGRDVCKLTLSADAKEAYNEYDPLKITELDYGVCCRYNIEGCITGYDLEEDELNFVLACAKLDYEEFCIQAPFRM